MENEKIIFNIKDLMTGEDITYDYYDFVRIPIVAISEEESNNILKSIWREFDLYYSYKDENRCGWMYMPKRKTYKGKAYTFWGFMSTIKGNILWGCMYEQKGIIKEIAFLPRRTNTLNEETISCISESIKRGINRAGELYEFYAKCRIHAFYQGKEYFFKNYKTEHFMLKENYLYIKGKAYTINDFKNTINKKIPTICDILSMETNTLVEMDVAQLSEETIELDCEEVNTHFSDESFIDFIPLIGEKLVINKQILVLIEQYLVQYKLKDELQNVVNSSNVFREGLELEKQQELQTSFITETTVGVLKKYNQGARVNSLATAASLYLSSLENLTSIESNPEICPMCNQLKYGITHRVGDIAQKYFGEEMSKIMKKVYSKRSKFFHTSIPFSKNCNVLPMPLLDSSEDLGSDTAGFISVMLNGESYLVSVTNIREWVSFMIRQVNIERINTYMERTLDSTIK